MPDYNPAIAAQVQPPQAPAQPNFAQTLMQASEIQRNKASQALAEAQALQSQRKYNGLMAFSQSLAHNGDTNAAYQAGLAGGADPQDLKNGLDSFSQAKYMQGHNNMDPQTFSSNASGLSSLASAAKTQAGIPGELAGSDQKISDLSAQHANQYIANPTQANWDDNVALTQKYKGSLAAAQLSAIKDPDQRMALMKGHVGGGLTAEQATKLETTTGGQGVTSPLERLSAPVGNTQATPQAGQAQVPQAGQQPGLLGGRPAPSVGAVKTQELDAAQYSKVLSGLQAQANTSASQLPHIQMAKALINSPDFYSGTAEGPVLGYKRLLAATGIDPGASLPQEAFRKTMAANILHQVDDLKASAQEMGSSTSRIFGSQIELMEKAAQNPDNSIAANRFLTELSSRAAQRNMTIGDMAADYKQQHGSLDVGFEKSLRNWMTKNPMFSPKELANPSLIGAAPPFKEGATATNPQTKAKMTFTNGQWQ